MRTPSYSHPSIEDLKADGFLLFENPPDKYGQISYTIWRRWQNAPQFPQQKETP